MYEQLKTRCSLYILHIVYCNVELSYIRLKMLQEWGRGNKHEQTEAQIEAIVLGMLRPQPLAASVDPQWMETSPMIPMSHGASLKSLPGGIR